MSHIVKRAGHLEPYDPRKLYASIYAACLAVKVPAPEAELVADRVTHYVSEWIREHDQVTSGEIYRGALHYLRFYNPDAAYLYETHRRVS